MAELPLPPYPPLPPLPKMLLCVGGPLAGKMARFEGHTLVGMEIDRSAENRLPTLDEVLSFNVHTRLMREVRYRVVMFQCGRDAYYMWTCLDDGDTLAELMNFYGTNKERISQETKT